MADDPYRSSVRAPYAVPQDLHRRWDELDGHMVLINQLRVALKEEQAAHSATLASCNRLKAAMRHTNKQASTIVLPMHQPLIPTSQLDHFQKRNADLTAFIDSIQHRVGAVDMWRASSVPGTASRSASP
ncbi:hypothetical protein BD626DRAFT_576210 [Schizophyllum amplum]|uniref:Uncharacterized protein n=1 Tax=Schizophyllum amplum TaxID=97359 RepID=A0A550BU44_9AGAR|nr:hypothetical protein BD626DRAFT_576210 [Auriculariopsis ampla]